MKYRLTEIFYSLQGEGHHTGRASVFVRFSGCNLKCRFCDTDHPVRITMTAEEIVREIEKYPADWVVLTGGEPSLQVDEALVAAIKATGRSVAIETNGTNTLPPSIDWVTLSPKDAPVVADLSPNEIKVVDTGQPLEPYFELECRRPDTLMYLQPCHVEDPDQFRENTARTVARVLDDPRWRLSVQTHKYLDIQ